MSDQVKPDDVVIVHHTIGSIAAPAAVLAELLQRGRGYLPENHLAGARIEDADPLTIVILEQDPRNGQLIVAPGPMTWLAAGGVTHISPCERGLALKVLEALDAYRLRAAGIALPTAREAAAARVTPPEYTR